MTDERMRTEHASQSIISHGKLKLNSVYMSLDLEILQALASSLSICSPGWEISSLKYDTMKAPRVLMPRWRCQSYKECMGNDRHDCCYKNDRCQNSKSKINGCKSAEHCSSFLTLTAILIAIAF